MEQQEISLRPGGKIIDGSILEGGGQILRATISVASYLGIDVIINRIRCGRSKPGLLAQHMLALKMAADITQARHVGLQMGSTKFTYLPSGLIKSGYFEGDTKTAGSTTLVVQCLLPILLRGTNKSELIIRGGTNASFAPPIDYYIFGLFPLLRRKLGFEIEISLNRRGFYPLGGGEIRVEVTPLNHSISGFDLTDRGEVKRIYGIAFVTGKLPEHLANEMAIAAKRQLSKDWPNISIEIEARKEEKAVGSSASVVLFAETSTGCFFSGSALPKSPKERIDQSLGIKAAASLQTQLDTGGAVDEYTQDQLIVFMGLAKTPSSILCGPLTLHTKTVIHVVEQLCGVKFEVMNCDNNSQKNLISTTGQPENNCNRT